MSNKNRIQEYLKIGIQFHQSGDLEKAKIQYTKILKFDKKHPDASVSYTHLTLPTNREV